MPHLREYSSRLSIAATATISAFGFRECESAWKSAANLLPTIPIRTLSIKKTPFRLEILATGKISGDLIGNLARINILTGLNCEKPCEVTDIQQVINIIKIGGLCHDLMSHSGNGRKSLAFRRRL